MDASRCPSPLILPMIATVPALPGLLEIDLPPCEGRQKIVIERVPLYRVAAVRKASAVLPIDEETAYAVRYLRGTEAPRAAEA